MTHRLALLALGLLLLVLAGCGEDEEPAAPAAEATPAASGRLILATTTSTQDSGLLDELIPAFEGTSDCSVRAVAVGSGEAMTLGERGDADVLLVHSPEAEEAFMQEGQGSSRRSVMYNDFVLVGPPDDPAEIAEATSAQDAMQWIAEEEATFASRGDDSGTHAKELSLWEAAGLEPRGDWYVATGQGMGETLTIANQQEAYTLSDRGTFLATENLDLEVLAEGDQALLNPYHVIVVDEQGTNQACARAFSQWITSPGTQRTIGAFGREEYGQALFTPDA